MISMRSAAAAILACALGAALPAAAQPASNAPPDPERLALAGKIYALIGEQALGSVSRAMKTMMSASLAAHGARDDPRTRAVQAALDDSIDDMMPKVMQGTARIMAQDFSAEELQGMLAFYQSPTGEAVLHKMPVIMQQSMQISMTLLPGFMQKFEADYCGRVTCTPKERQAFAQLNAKFSQNAAAAGGATTP